MSEAIQLRFHDDKGGKLPLPQQCSIAIPYCETPEICQVVAASMEQILYTLALGGLDLRLLDGITLSRDC